MKLKAPSSASALNFCSGLIIWLLTLNAWAGVDWQAIPNRQITLFYPGQASWEWLLTEHKGAALIKAGQFCEQCHGDMQPEMGEKLVSGNLFEPEPIPGKAGSIKLDIKTAHDAENLYIHLEWKAGTTPDNKKLADNQSMASIILDDGQVPEITRGGCWGACHDDMNGMASADTTRNTGKYLVKSRSKMTRKGGADYIKSAEELNKLLAAGFFAEIWQAQLNPGQAAKATDGYILETRHNHTPAHISVNAELTNGKWTVDFSRKLILNSPTYKNIEKDKTYTIGFAIHDGYVNGRRHYVSFEQTLRLDEGPADFIAVKQ